MNDTWMILGMAVITLFIKAGLFMLGDRVVFPELLKSALGFVPVTVLTAIIVPMILAPGGQGAELTWRNPQLMASAVAVLVCLATRRQMLTIVIGLAAFFCWKWLLAA